MSYTIHDLNMDVLPRVGNIDKSTGISIIQAANSVLSLIYKRLIYNKSDLQASGVLDLNLPAFSHSVALPPDFVSMAERPKSYDVYTDWMSGTITSYDNTTGALGVLITNSNGTDTLTSWFIAIAGVPGSDPTTIGTSVSSLTVGTGAKSLVTQPKLNLQVGQYVVISVAEFIESLVYNHHHLEPTYLNEDLDHDDFDWWSWYGIYGVWEYPPFCRPQYFKVIGTTLYVRPKVINNVIIKGRYNAKPPAFTLATDVIPWNGFFDEVFREGVIMILVKGIAFPDVEPAFQAFINREIDFLTVSRSTMLPSKNRMHRRNYM